MTSPQNPRAGDRIAKLLARAGIASRREVERMIAEGRVKLGDDVLTTANTVLTSLRGVTVDGKAVKAAEAATLYAFNKPPRADHCRARSGRATNDLRRAAQCLARGDRASDAGRAARFQHRGAAAADQ